MIPGMSNHNLHLPARIDQPGRDRLRVDRHVWIAGGSFVVLGVFAVKKFRGGRVASA